MNAVFVFCASMLIASGLLALLSWLLTMRLQRARHWPAFWAALLCVSVMIPLLGFVIARMPGLVPSFAVEMSYLHAPMEAVDWLILEPWSAAGPSNSQFQASLVTLVAVIYLLGTGVFLLRLLIGRYRVRSIARNATPILHSSGSRIWITPHNTAPFAYTPLGRQRDAIVVIPESFIEQFTADELADVVEHERSHIQQRDDEWGMVLRVVLAVCWLSPFAHAFFSRWIESVEIRCDTVVTKQRIPEDRRAYARTLLKAFRITANRVLQYPAASFSTRHLRSEKMRIEQILTGNSPTFKNFRHHAVLLIAAFCILLAGAMVLAPAAGADMPGDNSAAIRATNMVPNGRLTSPYGMVGDPFNKVEMRMHKGVDVAAAKGTPIFAPAAGVVIEATDLYTGEPAYGKVVVFKTGDGIRILFAHLDSYSVMPGQRIPKGARIATVGNTGQSTGPHVHIETFKSGERIDPLTVLPLFETHQI